MNTSGNYANAPALITVGIITIVIVIVLIIILRKRAAMVKNYARKHGYTVGTIGTDFSNIESSFLRKPNQSTTYSLLMTGTLQAQPFRMFNYAYFKGRTIHDNESVLEVSHTMNIPSFIVYRVVLKQHYDRWMPSTYSRINIDEAFNKYLDLYVPQGKQEEVLSFLTPSKRDLLLDLVHRKTGVYEYANDINGFEFTPHKLYIYRFLFGKEKHLDESIVAADTILTHFR